MTPEGRTKRLIKDLLEKYKIYPASKAGAFPDDAAGWYFMPVSASAFGVAGIPDFIGFLYRTGGYAEFWAIEAKAPGRKTTGFQNLQIVTIRSAGGTVFVVDGEESLAEVEKWLNL